MRIVQISLYCRSALQLMQLHVSLSFRKNLYHKASTLNSRSPNIYDLNKLLLLSLLKFYYTKVTLCENFLNLILCMKSVSPFISFVFEPREKVMNKKQILLQIVKSWLVVLFFSIQQDTTDQLSGETKNKFIGKISGIWRGHLDHRTSWLRSDEDQIPTDCDHN